MNSKKLIALISLIILVLLAPAVWLVMRHPQQTEASWWDDAWLYRFKYTIDNSNVGETLTDFPLHIDLTNDAPAAFWSHVKSDGSDIRIWSEDHSENLTTQAHLEGWNQGSSQGHIWVKKTIPVSTDPEYLWIYYGNPSAQALWGESNTYNSNYVGVWHLDEDPTGGATPDGSDEIFDSTGNDNDGNTGGSMTSDDQVTGKVDGADDFDGTDDYISIGDEAVLETSGQKTASAWVKPDNNNTGKVAVSKYKSDTVEDGWIIAMLSNGTIDTWIKNDANETFHPGTLPYEANTWYHIAMTWNTNGGTVKLYVNGDYISQSGTISGNFSGNSRVAYIGRAISGAGGISSPFDGLIDDVRISNTVRSAEWLEFAYLSDSGGSGSAASEEQAPGPVAYWKFDEGVDNTCSGGTNDVCDSSSNSNDGAISGATWQSEDMCKSGKCLKFDGTDDYVTRADDPDFDFAASDTFTIQGWIRHGPQSSGQDIVLAKYESTGADGGYKLLMEADGDITFGIDDDNSSFPEDSVTSTAATYDDNQWHHLTAIKNGTASISLYIDGQLIATDAAISASNTLANDDALYIGIDGDGSSNAWLGFIDEVKIYPYVRSAAQIKTDFLRGSASHGSSAVLGQRDSAYLSEGLVGYWKMDEASWTNNCSTDSALDSSGNGNHGDSCPSGSGPTGGAAGKFGNGGDFDGSDNYVDLGTNASLNFLANQTFSINAWIKTSEDYGAIISFRHSTDDHPVIDIMVGYDGNTDNAGKVMALIRDDSHGGGQLLEVVGASINDGQWHHVVLTRGTGSVLELFLDGVSQGTDSGVGGDGAFTTNLRALGSERRWVQVGSQTPDQRFLDGLIDEVRIYNRALSPSEVQDLYEWAPGPVGHWKLDEKVSGDSQTIYDSSTYGNNGSTSSANGTGMDCTVPGKYGGGCEFDGSDDYVSLVDVGNQTGSITIAAWAKVNDNNAFNLILTRGTAADQPNFEFSIDTTLDRLALVWKTSDDSTWRTQVTASGIFTAYIGKWTHIVVVHTFGTTTDDAFYINGVPVSVASSSTQAPYTGGTQLSRIGRRATNTNPFNGTIDDVRIYNYARTQKQIIEDMNAGHPAVGSPVGSALTYWKFDEGYGTTAQDSSNNNKDLTLSTASWTNSGKFGKAFDGGDNKRVADGADDNDLDFTATEDFSLSAWVKYGATNPTATEYILHKQTGYEGYALYMDADGDLIFGIGDTSSASFPEDTAGNIARDYADNTWHHLVGVKTSNSKIEMYVDANLIGSDTSLAADGTLENSAILYIGDANATDGTDEFLGDIDEVKIYNFALSADEIKQEYNKGASVLMGAVGTDSSGNPSWSSERSYCPPGDTTASCGPVAEWKMDEKVSGNGQTLYDTSENNNNGTTYWGGNAAGMNCTVPGKYGGGCDFDGTDDYVNCGNDSSLDIGTNDLTLAAWAKIDSTGSTHQIISRYGMAEGDIGDAGYYLGINGSGNPYFTLRDDTDNTSQTITSDNALTIGTWYHIAGLRNVSNTQIELYVDGVKVKNDTLTETGTFSEWNNTIVCIGAKRKYYTPGSLDVENYFNGLIDEVRIYNYALSQAQIAWEYNRGRPISHWKFDECQGNTVYDWEGSNNGTITIGVSGTQDDLGTCTDGDTTNAWYNGRTGKWNYSLSFDGTDDYVTIGDVTDVDSSNTAISISAWFKVNSLPTNTANRMSIVNKYDASGSEREFMLLIGSDSASDYDALTWNVQENANSYNPSTEIEGGTIQAGQWYHATATFQGGTSMYLYLNGDLIASLTSGVPNDFTDTTEPLYIGYMKDWSKSIDGLIDDVRIYNYALTPLQIQQVYNQGSAVRFGPSSGAP